jgi:putative CocE/NonD family hydrolase
VVAAHSLILCVIAATAALGDPANSATNTVAEPRPPLQSFGGYHRSRYFISMRDGVSLDTRVLAPDDNTHSYPILLVRTPYDPTEKWFDPTPAFLAARYIFVTQSVRGRYASGGRFIQMRPIDAARRAGAATDESTDAFDTIDWLVKNIPQNNGRVGLEGISYDGFYAAAGMIAAHPALKAVSPQAPQADWFAGDDVHHNGAFLLAATFPWLASCDRRSDGERACGPTFAPTITDGYQFYLAMGPLSNADSQYLFGNSPEWLVTMRHGSYDALWQRRNILPRLRDIRPAVLVVGGWYDANNLYGSLHIFEAIKRQSPRTPIAIVLGPWTHGQWLNDPGDSIGTLKFGEATSADFIEKIELPFYESYLKSDAHPHLPVAFVFDTGRKVWNAFGAWPPPNTTIETLYLRSRGFLSFLPPGNATTPPYDEYVSDPANPVPYEPNSGVDMDPAYMAQDQRFARTRSDILVYQTDPLPNDVTVVGPIRPILLVSTSGTDSDWIVKLIDVHPTLVTTRPSPEKTPTPSGDIGEFEELVRGDVMRSKFRHSLSAPIPMRADEPTAIEFTMPDVYHTFKKGHRIMVHIQSSWFPLIDRNPQRYEDIYAATASDFQKAIERVYHSPLRASRIDLNVLPAGR